jgi:hypothetical protein
MAREYIIYADESVVRGEYYSNFYGGLLVRSTDLKEVETSLNKVKIEQNLFNEIKWQKVTGNYLKKYMKVIDVLFDFVEQDKIKIRIMFTQNRFEPTNLEDYHYNHEYFLLYYQFIKHAFGLKYSNQRLNDIKLRVYFDRLPDTKEKSALFKSHISSLEKSPELRRQRILIPDDQITEIKSHNHVLLQCIDIVLGAMQFRLNDLHKVKPKGKCRRGKRTIAKEKLYKFINNRIQKIYPNFNIGITTGTKGDQENYWRHSYRHWLFRPRLYRENDSKTKK